MKILGCLVRVVLFIVAYTLFCILPPAAAALLMFIALTNHFYNKENRHGRQ